MRIEPEKRLIDYAANPDVLKISKGVTIESGGQTITAGGQTITAGGQTITAGGQTITAGGQTITAGDLTLTAGNLVQTIPNDVIADPGNGNTITPTSGAVKNICTITTAGVETRVLGTPEFIGQELIVEFGTDGGNFTITNNAGFNDDTTTSDVATFDDAGDSLVLISVDTTDGDDWRMVAKKGVTLA